MRKKSFFGLFNVMKLMAKGTTESKEGQWLAIPKATNNKRDEKQEIARKQLKKMILD
ncbi:hypothetical protein ACFLQ8_02930 [Candidatus Auribacterota bacterium]